MRIRPDFAPQTPVRAFSSSVPKAGPLQFAGQESGSDHYVFNGTPGKVRKVPEIYRSQFFRKLDRLPYNLPYDYEVTPKGGSWGWRMRVGENPYFGDVLKRGEVLITPKEGRGSEIRSLKLSVSRKAWVYSVKYELTLKDGSGFKLKDSGFWDHLSHTTRNILEVLGRQTDRNKDAEKANRAAAKERAREEKRIAKAGDFDIERLNNFKL